MVNEDAESPTGTLVPPRAWPDVDHVITEDDTPVDGEYSARQMRLLVGPLKDSWPGPSWDPRFECTANVGVFESVNLPPIVPDFFLALGVVWPEPSRLKRNRSYFMEAFGKPPDLVVEIVSNNEGGEDTRKIEQYAHLRVRYYLIHDPERIISQQVLRVYELVNGRLLPTDQRWFDGVELGVTLWRGEFEGHEDLWLRWTDRDGHLIPTGKERADRERAEREAAERRIADLEARLKSLEPPSDS